MVPDTPADTPAGADAALLRAQLERLRAVLHPDDPAASPCEAVELVGLDDGAVFYIAVRASALPLPRPGIVGDWRLTTLSLTGLDAERMRFVPVPAPVAADVFARLGLPTRLLTREGLAAPPRCTSVHALIRDHAREGRTDGEAGRRPGQTPVPGSPP